MFAHSNNCSGLIQINWCEMCEREVISKAVLKKHIMSCKGKKEKALCRNGDKCRYLKADRCMFEHK